MFPASRLQILRENDSLRTWPSVDEVRVCVACGRKLTGRTISISRKANRCIFQCPTPGCGGSLPDFAKPGNPLIDDAVWQDWALTLETNKDDSGALDEESAGFAH